MMPIDRRRLLTLLAAAALPKFAAADPTGLAELPGSIAAPDFALPDLSGTIRRLSDHRGRTVLVSFWAVWCPPCRRELGALSDLRARLIGNGIEVFGVNVGDSPERIAAFLADHPAPHLQVLRDGAPTATAWRVRDLPVAFAVDPAGILRLGALGERDWRTPEIERQLRSLA
jgi:peroxiredoxin